MWSTPSQTDPVDRSDASYYDSLVHLSDSLLVQAGQPRSAATYLERMLRYAQRTKDVDWQIRLRVQLAMLEGSFSEVPNAAILDTIRNMQIDAVQPASAILHSVYASALWGLYQDQHWRIRQRTDIPGDTATDTETWSAARFYRETLASYQRSLQDPDVLTTFRARDYLAVLDTAEYGDLRRPTLYDILADRKIEFLRSCLEPWNRPIEFDEFAGLAALAPRDEFVNSEFDSGHPVGNILNEYANLMRRHVADGCSSCVDAYDLDRLKLAGGQLVAPNKDSLYLKRLTELGAAAEAEVASLALFAKAAHLYDVVDDRVAAVDECRRVLRFLPETRGAAECRNLTERITARSVSVEFPNRVQPDKAFPISISSTNVDKLYLRVYRIDMDSQWEVEYNYRNRKLFTRGKPLREWQIDIINKGDFRQQSAETAVEGLPVGIYVVHSSHRPDFNIDSAAVSQSVVFFSRLAAVQIRKPSDAGTLRIVDAKDGKALSNVEALVFIRDYDRLYSDYQEPPLREILSRRSNAKGEVELGELAGNQSCILVLIKGDDTLSFGNQSLYGMLNRGAATERIETSLFTDRSIYRPGQPIYFKGISFFKSRDEKERRVAVGHSEWVYFSDANGREVARLQVKTNEFGSFQGSFVAPGALTGRHVIRVENGSVSFNIEEYKRPRFEVKVLPNDSTWRLNENVKLRGHVQGLAGFDIADAQISYTVQRLPLWRPWWRYSSGRRRIAPSYEPVLISSGTAVSDSAGGFDILFSAAVPYDQSDETTIAFNYRVEVQATDPAGETRTTDYSVKIGARALEIDAAFGGEIDLRFLKDIEIRSTNLDGRPVAAAGTVVLEKLKSPDRILRDRLWDVPDTSLLSFDEHRKLLPNDPWINENDETTWPVRDRVFEAEFNNDADGKSHVALRKMEPGVYRITLRSRDVYGGEVEVQKTATLYDPTASRPPLNEPFALRFEKTSVEVGDTLRLTLSSAYSGLRVVLRLSSDRNELMLRDLTLDNEQKVIELPVRAEHRGGIEVQARAVRDYRTFGSTQHVNVPWSDKRLKLHLATYRDKTRPGAAEEWKLTVSGYRGEAVVAELLAAMYDASLDEFADHSWVPEAAVLAGESIFGWNQHRRDAGFDLNAFHFPTAEARVFSNFRQPYFMRAGELPYDRLLNMPQVFTYYRNSYGYGKAAGNLSLMERSSMAPAETALARSDSDDSEGILLDKHPESNDVIVQYAGVANATAANLSVQQSLDFVDKRFMGGATPARVRSDFRETAFFAPQVRTNDKGEFVLTFTTPDALTRWRFMALAHTAELQGAYLETEVVTQKELMLLPNMPRFLRAGDEIELPVQVRNMLDKSVDGRAVLRLTNALTGEPLSNAPSGAAQQEFKIAPKSAQTLHWKVNVPQGVEMIACKLEASTADFTDAEENVLPVLPDRRLVTEALAMFVRPGQSKTFKMPHLLEAAESSTLKHRRLSFELTQNPVWYVVQALPYMIEYPRECSEQIYSRLFANALAGKILRDNPRIKSVLDEWRRKGQIKSPLERNEDLKALLLEATPWLFEGQSQSEQMRRIALLFDMQKLNDGLLHTVNTLSERQLSSGAWPWFNGGRPDVYITAHIAAGLGHLMKVEAVQDNQTLSKVNSMYNSALRFLDQEFNRSYRHLRAVSDFDSTANYLNPTAALYLYTRSFKPQDEVRREFSDSWSFWLQQSQLHWLKQSNMTQSLIGLALNRYDDETTARAIVNSLRERAVQSDEFGMYWKVDAGWYWYNSGIESQAAAIELFSEVAEDEAAVAELQMWLLQRKRTTHWGNTRATALACFAMLERGSKMLAERGDVRVQIGGEEFKPEAHDDVEYIAGLEYTRVDWSGGEVSPRQGEVEIDNRGTTPGWGGLYWQYFEDLDKIPAADDGPLSIRKRLFIREKSIDGESLREVDSSTPLQVGQTLVVRVEIRVDRQMEYIHVQDMRGAGFEPREVVSGHRWQDGTSYYLSVRDASVNMFFSRLRPGAYVLEYDLYVAHRGRFSNGISTIQSMYAPEFAGHTAGVELSVR